MHSKYDGAIRQFSKRNSFKLVNLCEPKGSGFDFPCLLLGGPHAIRSKLHIPQCKISTKTQACFGSLPLVCLLRCPWRSLAWLHLSLAHASPPWFRPVRRSLLAVAAPLVLLSLMWFFPGFQINCL